MIEDDERKIAAKNLLAFISDYTALLLNQIEAIKKGMAVIVDEVMDNVEKISSAKSAKTRMAESILLNDQDKKEQASSYNFREVSAKSRFEAENAHLLKDLTQNSSEQKHTTNQPIKQAHHRLKDYMKHLDELDTTMQKLVFTMVGALSADDVVGQRIDHVAGALGILKDSLKQIVEGFEANFSEKMIEDFSDDINNKIYACYTMQEEREAFVKIHGFVPSVKKPVDR